MPSLHAHAELPGGNAALIRCSDDPPTVSFLPDPRRGPESLWFYLAVESRGCTARQFRLELEQPGNLLGAKPERCHPVYRLDGGDWLRLEAGLTVTHPDGCQTAVWTVPVPKERCEIAFCYPYGMAEFGRLTSDLPGWIVRTLGVSEGGRALHRLANHGGETGSNRPGIYLLGRQHSGETPASWVMDGFLRRIHRLGTAAPLVWAVPFVDIDGVIDGQYGKDRHPWDFNRAWTPNAMRHEVLAIQRDIRRFAGRCRPVLALDLHGPAGDESEGAYFFLPKAQDLPASHALSKHVAQHLLAAMGADVHPNGIHVADYWSRWPTPNATEWCARQLGCAAMTLETPYQGSASGLFTRERYQELGARLAEAASALNQ